jgi:hypothetical protein
LDALLDAGIDCSLHNAVFGNHLGGVEACLKKEDTKVNGKDKSGKTALFVACEMGHTDIVRRLLSVNGIQIQQEKTTAEEKNDDDTVLNEGAEVEVKCHGWTKYYRGQVTEINEDGTYNILFEDGERKKQVPAEQIKVFDPLDIACANGHNEIVKLLLAVDGIDSNRITNGITPLQRTKQRNRADIATILMNAGVDCSLHDAVFWNHLEAVERCLKKEDTNVNDKDKSEKTALFVACEMDHTDIIRRLLSVDGIQIQQEKMTAEEAIRKSLHDESTAAAHTGNYRRHDDDCWCMMGGGYCNRGGFVWSCCGAIGQASSCAGEGRQHHTAVSDRSDAGPCQCRECVAR